MLMTLFCICLIMVSLSSSLKVEYLALAVYFVMFEHNVLLQFSAAYGQCTVSTVDLLINLFALEHTTRTATVPSEDEVVGYCRFSHIPELQRLSLAATGMQVAIKKRL